jgi:hypothetical protein
MNRAERVVESMIVEPLEWVREQGIVLQSARGPVPNLAEYVAGEPIRGSWWGHASGHEIFAVLSRVLNSPDVIATRLVNGKVTLIHRRLWPALFRVADRASPRNAWLPSTRSTLPRAPTEPPRSPFPNGSLPKKSPPRGYSLWTTRSHNCQTASADPGGWTSLRLQPVGVIADRCWDQIIGDLWASAGDESTAREYPAADISARPSRPARHDAHQCDQTSERRECRPC